MLRYLVPGIRGGGEKKAQVCCIEDLDKLNYDYILLMADALLASRELKRNPQMISYKVFDIVGFDFVKYIKLREDRISIIANDCWGGLAYHCLQLQFASPFINCWMGDKDYIRLLQDFKTYLSMELQCESEGNLAKLMFPVGSLGDGNDKVHIMFNHYYEFQKAKEDWDRRKQRINYDNMFIVMSPLGSVRKTLTENEFEKLPWRKKAFFCVDSFKRFRYMLQKNYTAGIGSQRFHNYLRNISEFMKSVDILALLNGEEDYWRET